VTGRAFQSTSAPFNQVPDVSHLFLDYAQNWSSVASLYGSRYDFESVAAFARQCARPPEAAMMRLCDALGAQQDRFGGSRRGVDKLRNGAVAVITGQQAGLFSGPLYALYKAMTAIKLARALDEQGIPATPVFWIASEDHDHDEIRWATVLDRDGAPRRIEVDLSGNEAAPVGWTRYDESVGAAVAQLFEHVQESEFNGEIRKLLDETCMPGASPVDAFGRILARLFSHRDLTLVDPLDPPMKRLAEPALEEAVRRNEEVREAVRRQGRTIEQLGYHEQVRVTETFTGLFAYENGARRTLKPNELSSGLAGLALSPNVLLRPVIQDTLFPTAAYVGGPAEIAYFAQASAVYRVMGRSMPPLVPRISATLVEPRIARALESYRLDPADAWQGREFLARKAGRTLEGATAFDRAHDAVSAAVESLRTTLVVVDPTLGGALDNSRQKMLHQVETLRTKYVQAEARRNEVMDRRLDAITNALYPEKKLQEREDKVLSFLCRYGLGAVGRIEAQLSMDAREHEFVGIE
jgi:uncharacterized protein YllA (UPF0747 family)